MRLSFHRATGPLAGVAMVTALSALLGIAVVAFASPVLAGNSNQVKVFFLNTGVQAKAVGKLLFVANPAQSNVKITVARMAPGTYDVGLNGAIVDTLKVNAKGKGTLQHRSLPATKRSAGVPIPYDPRGGQLTVLAGGTVLLEAEVPETPEESEQKIEIEADLANLGVVSGEAEAEFESVLGRMQFEVHTHGTPAGTFDLLVDGVKQGEFTTGVDGDGKIEFDSMPSSGVDDDGESEGGLDNLLTFDPRGKTITIAQGGTDVFSSVFPLTGSEGDDEGETCDDGDGGDGGDGGGEGD